jgi:hypothetical protein
MQCFLNFIIFLHLLTCVYIVWVTSPCSVDMLKNFWISDFHTRDAQLKLLKVSKGQVNKLIDFLG